MIAPSIMTRTRVLLGFVAVVVLLALALSSLRQRHSPSAIAPAPDPQEPGETQEPAELALDTAAEPGLRSSVDSKPASDTPPVSGNARLIVLAGVVLDHDAGSQGPGRPAVGVRVAWLDSDIADWISSKTGAEA